MTKTPPKPTDLSYAEEYSVDRCHRCLQVVQDRHEHREGCAFNEKLTNVIVNDQFGVVVPEKTGYIWTTKTCAFANRHINIQGTYIPLGDIQRHIHYSGDIEETLEDSAVDFDEISEHTREIIKKGMVESDEYDYGYIDLGQKLVRERLDGVYDDDEEIRKEKRQSRDSRICAVWDEINEQLPFTYERVVAPEGYPRTREGMRWISITGHNYPDYAETERQRIRFRRQWVENLVDRGPVAFYYPNSD